MALTEIEAATLRGYCVDYALRCHPKKQTAEQVIDSARKIEQFVFGRQKAQLTVLNGGGKWQAKSFMRLH